MMNYFPDEVIEHIFDYVVSHRDRNALSLVCKSWYRIERCTRQRVFIGNCYSISPERLIQRFPGLKSLTLKGKPHFADFSLVPYGWGGFVYPWIEALAKSRVGLEELRLKRMVVSDESLELLSRSFTNFKSLVLVSCEGFTTDGLAAVAANCRYLRELDLQENEVEDHKGHWLSCFPDSCTSLVSLNFACLKGEVSLGALERLVARSPNLKSLKLNRSVPLDALQRIMTRAPQLADLGIGSFVQDPESEVFIKLKNTILKCKSITSLSGLLEVAPHCLAAIYPICPNLTSLNLSYAAGVQGSDLIKLIRHCVKLQRLWIMDCIGDKGLGVVAKTCTDLQELRVFPSVPFGNALAVTEVGLVAISMGCPKLHSLLYFCQQMTNAALITVAKNCPNFIRFRLCILDATKPDPDTMQPLDEGEEESTSVESNTANERIKLNVGGKYFETTLSTLRSGGPDSLLFALSNRRSADPNPVFIDRDPEIFSVLLSLLRTSHLPSTARRFSKQELADEALFYGIDAHLRAATAPPPFSGIDAALAASIRPASEGLPSSFAAADSGAVWIAHGGQISGYDSTLTHSGTVRTHLDEIDSICRVWPEIAAIGSMSDPGLHFYNFSGSRHVGSVHWTDPLDPRIFKAHVNAITASENSVFASFDCPHRENCILEVDKTNLRTVNQFARQSGNQAKNMVPAKLTWIPATGVLFSSAVTGGAFGFSGYVRLWDPRSGEVVWETNEPGGSGRSSRFGDSFADVEADVEGLLLFKLCSKSGDLAMADMRFLKDDPWIYLKEKNASLVSCGEVRNSVVHCYRRQVFVSREGGLEVWSRVEQRENVVRSENESDAEGFYRRNFVDKREDSDRGIIKKIEGGGDRLFVSREDVEGIEVWESSRFSGAISVL